MKIYFVGICGIGMSALAQAFAYLGHEIAGSDREISPDGVNAKLIYFLKKKSIKIFPQDGSFIKSFVPDMIVYSSAIENDNKDFVVSSEIKKIHRSEALKLFLNQNKDKISIAVTGTSGKTTVSAWMAESLFELGLDPCAIIGGRLAKFAKEGEMPGNFIPGRGRYIVFEADESDKSILNYSCDYAVILNTGTDHYPVEEQNTVFAKFSASAKQAVICNESLKDIISPSLLSQRIYTFGRGEKGTAVSKHIKLENYVSAQNSSDNRAHAKIKEDSRGKIFDLRMPCLGEHNALNAASIIATLRAIGVEGEIFRAVSAFGGVQRRFNICGKNIKGCTIIDDYAHNPDKIENCIKTAKESCSGRLFFVFQPHGYRPFAFMLEELAERLKNCLGKNDIFILLPVFYAGGNTSFKPSSEEAAAIFAKNAINCRYFPDRDDVKTFLLENSEDKDICVIAGARDDTLSDWANSLIKK